MAAVIDVGSNHRTFFGIMVSAFIATDTDENLKINTIRPGNTVVFLSVGK